MRAVSRKVAPSQRKPLLAIPANVPAFVNRTTQSCGYRFRSIQQYERCAGCPVCFLLGLYALALRGVRLSLDCFPFGDQSEVTPEATEDVCNPQWAEVISNARQGPRQDIGEVKNRFRLVRVVQ